MAEVLAKTKEPWVVEAFPKVRLPMVSSTALEPVKATVALELPIVIAFELVFPMFSPAAPVVSKVRAEVPPLLMVNAPESAMLLVVNVWEPMTVPVINVPTPAFETLVVPPKVSAPEVIATFPVLAVKEVPVIAPAPMVPAPETLPDESITMDGVFK